MANEESNNNQDQQESILSEESVKDSGENSGNSGDANDSAVQASLNGDSGSDAGEDSNSDSGSGENQSSDSGSGESQNSNSGSNSDGSGNERKTVHPSARKTSIDTSVMAAALVDPLETLPERVFVIPVYGRPFVPGQILPVQIAAKPWQKTIEMVLKTSHWLFSVFLQTRIRLR